MSSFLGVPILIEGVASGSLYVAEKQGGEFTEADEEAAVILADWAASAIKNARRYHTFERPRVELEHTVRGLDTTPDGANVIGNGTGLERVLELIIERGRALIDARGTNEGGVSTHEEKLLREFAASAAGAVAMAQTEESDRLRGLMAATDAERSRWARELHDEDCRASGPCACCSPPPDAAETPSRSSSPWTRRLGTSIRRSRTCTRLSAICVRPRSTSLGCAPRSKRSSNAAANTAN